MKAQALLTFGVRRPFWVLAIGIAVVMLSAAGIFSLKLKTDGRAMVPKSSTEFKQDQDIRFTFGSGEQIMVILQTSHEDGIFNRETFVKLIGMSGLIRRIQGVDVSRLTSLTTIQQRHQQRDFKRYPHLIDFNFLQDSISNLRDIMHEMDFLHGVMISLDGDHAAGKRNWKPSATVIWVGLQNREYYDDVLSVLNKIAERFSR